MRKANYLLIIILFFVLQSAQAQKSQNLAQNTQPQNGGTILIKDPVTQCAYRYNYFPNLGAYYDAKTNQYIYSQNGQWIKAKEIPSGYMGYSLNNKMNVVITDYDDDDPTQFIKIHKKKFPYNYHQKNKQLSSRE
jgi:hypothetical protein